MTNQDIISGSDKKPRILVADDTDVNQKIAQLILQKAGYEVDVVANGQQAVEICRRHRFDLILMDIQMPVMDGHEATKKIRKWEKKLKAQSSELKVEKEGKYQESNINGEDSDELSALQSNGGSATFSFELSARAQRVPIIAMTGSAGLGSFDEALYPGMNDCIGKPLQRDFLLALVQKWIGAESQTHLNENPAGEAPAMDKGPANNPCPLDLERAIQEFMGRKDILLGVLQDFSENAASRIDTIRWAVRGAEYSVIGSEAHAIKGAAANLTADKLARLASDLEQAADQQQADLTAELAAKLEREFDTLKKYIQQLPEV